MSKQSKTRRVVLAGLVGGAAPALARPAAAGAAAWHWTDSGNHSAYIIDGDAGPPLYQSLIIYSYHSNVGINYDTGTSGGQPSTNFYQDEWEPTIYYGHSYPLSDYDLAVGSKSFHYDSSNNYVDTQLPDGSFSCYYNSADLSLCQNNISYKENYLGTPRDVGYVATYSNIYGGAGQWTWQVYP